MKENLEALKKAIKEYIFGKNGSKLSAKQQQQIPPMVSAIKVNGKKLYEYAREGIEIERSFLFLR